MPNMKPLDPFASILHDLTATGAVASSRLSTKLRQKCMPLLDAGVIEEIKSGAGRAIRVVKIDALESFAKKCYPAGLSGEESREPSRRGQSVEQFRDSKAKAGLDFEFLRYRLIARPFQVGNITQEGDHLPDGFGCTVLHDDRTAHPWPVFSGHVATVENPTVLLRFPWKQYGIDLAVLTSGRASTRMINWLASDAMGGSTVTHFGDYDPVGLSEFIRLERQLGKRATLFIPGDIEDLFRKYGNPALLTKSATLLQNLSTSQNRDIHRILALTREHGGLEHESIILRQEQQSAISSCADPINRI